MRQLLSDTAPFKRDPLGFFVERARTATEPLMPLHLKLRSRIYLLTDPEYIKPLVKIPEDNLDKSPLIEKFRVITGNNIVILTGDEHRRRRAVWHEIVKRPAAEGMVPALAVETRRVLAEQMEAGTFESGEFDARELGVLLAFRLLCIPAFGQWALSKEDYEIVIKSLRQSLADLFDLVFEGLPPAPWTYVRRQLRVKRCRDDMKAVVKRVRDRFPETAAIRGLVDLGLSENNISDELRTFLIVGHDTTGAAATWLFHAMATIPGLAEKIAEEAAAVRDEDGSIHPEKLALATTTEAAVREILRLYPSGYWMARGVREDVELAGRKLRRGDIVIISPWMFHRSERFWDEPDEFRLDRNFNNKAYIPFGTGPRVCVGNSLALFELKVIALEFATAFHLGFNGSTPKPLTWVHLLPPPMSLQVRLRNTEYLSMPTEDPAVLAGATPQAGVQAEASCPFH